MQYLFVHEDREYVAQPGEELHSDLGVLTIPESITPGEVIETHLGEPFEARRLRGPDLFHHLQRTGAPMLPRDIGLIIGHTGIERSDCVLDTGTGSGVLAAYLGRVGAEVVSYERDSEFVEVARENMETAGVTANVSIRAADLSDELDTEFEKSPFDVFTLDTGDASSLITAAPDILSPGGFVAAYSPFIEQTRNIAQNAADVGLSEIQTYETIQREMEFGDRGSRPSTAGVGHSGYLTFARYHPSQ